MSEQFEQPPSDFEILCSNLADQVLAAIVNEARARFNFQLVTDGAEFGHFTFVTIPQDENPDVSELQAKVDLLVREKASTQITAAILDQRRMQTMGNRVLSTSFEFTQLDINWQPFPQPCIRVLYKLKTSVRELRSNEELDQ